MTVLIQIVGNVGRNPELVSFETGAKKAVFSVAVNDYYNKDKEGKPATTWYAVESWNGSTERVLELITQGREVMVSGKLMLQEYYSKAQQRYVTKPLIKMTDFHLCGRAPRKREEVSNDNQLEEAS